MTIRYKTLARVLASVSLLASLLSTPTNLTADTAISCRAGDASAACRYAKGLLWKIERSGWRVTPVY